MRYQTLLLVAAAMTVGCKKTSNGDVVVDRPTGITTTQDTLHPPVLTTKTDTINTPVVGVQKETVIVNKPVVGTQKTTVKVPVVTKP
jgi:hypothetical protein